MPNYNRPTKSLMEEWAKEHLDPGQIFDKGAPTRWFAERYPLTRPTTVGMHVEGMSVNNPVRSYAGIWVTRPIRRRCEPASR